MKRLAILGSTGSIGENALKVARAQKDRVRVSLLAAGRNVKRLIEQANEFRPDVAVIADPALLPDLRAGVPDGCEACAGACALCDAVAETPLDVVLVAIVGTGGFLPTLEAIRRGLTIALASKEVLVMAGRLVMTEAKRRHARILPVDSEHSAIFQCMEGRGRGEIAELVLTASGGPFRKKTLAEMDEMTWNQALHHPTWSMGPKVTVDSATLMNKALELIEARWLFDFPPEKLRVLIHPQSIVHSMIRFQDGSMLAQMSVPDMRFPIQYALTWPAHVEGGLEPLDLTAVGPLSFETPDETRFPSLGFAREALRIGGTAPAVLNAANEVAFARFRKGEIRFTDIWRVVERTLESQPRRDDDTLDAILSADADAREFAERLTLNH